MKVIHRSDSLLMIEDRPWLIGILMIGMILTFLVGAMALLSQSQMIGGLMMALLGIGIPMIIGTMMVQRVRLTFDRKAGQVIRTRRWVFGLTQETYSLDRLVEARVGGTSDSDETTYRMELLLNGPSETVPFTSYYASGRRPDVMAQTVNDWLRMR